LNWFAEFAPPSPEGRKAVVLGDMLELGPRSTQVHTEMGAWAAGLAPDLVVFVGNESRAAFEEGTRRLGDRQRLRHVPDSEKAASLVSEWVRPGDVVLVKGSRGMKMERVVRALVGEGESHAV
jgi:UDP-N-acetylmuramoyl-tripeptide--D-alanyl-D-alanine ligase